MKVGFEFGVAQVGAQGPNGALARIRGEVSAVKPTQIEALRAMEANISAALYDVRTLIDMLEAVR